MNKLQRLKNIFPNETPRWIRCYDNGGETFDRYTVVFTGNYTHKTDRQHWYLGMSEFPCHPQGFGQHGESDRQIDVFNGWAVPMGRKCHLGKRIPFPELPEGCRKLVLQDYKYLWDIDVLPFRKVKACMGRIGKCDCGGERAVYEIENDTAISYKCSKCKKVIQATD